MYAGLFEGCFGFVGLIVPHLVDNEMLCCNSFNFNKSLVAFQKINEG